MPLQVKSGGAWLTAPVSGKLAVKKDGVWYFPATAKIKDGGIWRDSGYLGYPGMPSTPWVVAWNYYDVHIAWNEPATGAPLASFEVQLLDVNGSVLQTQVPVSGGPNSNNRNDWAFRGLNALGKYQMRVRTKGTSGLYSNWTAVLKVAMGRAEIVTPRQELRERDYYGYTSHSGVGLGGWMTHVQPPNVRSTWMELHVYTSPHINPFCGTGGETNRRANWIVANQDWGNAGYHNSPWDEGKSYGVGYDYANSHQGIALTNANGPAWNSNRGYGSIHLWGYEQYWYYWNDVTPAIPNGYW